MTILSFFDGLGMGLGFSFALTCIGAIRELLGSGNLFGVAVMPDGFIPISIFVLAPGAFFVLAVLTAIQNAFKIRGEKRGKTNSKIQTGCNSDCMNCGDSSCKTKFFGLDDEPKIVEKVKTNKLSKKTVKKIDNETLKMDTEMDTEMDIDIDRDIDDFIIEDIDAEDMEGN